MRIVVVDMVPGAVGRHGGQKRVESRMMTTSEKWKVW